MPSSSQEASRCPVRLVRALVLHPPHVAVGPAVGTHPAVTLRCSSHVSGGSSHTPPRSCSTRWWSPLHWPRVGPLLWLPLVERLHRLLLCPSRRWDPLPSVQVSPSLGVVFAVGGCRPRFLVGLSAGSHTLKFCRFGWPAISRGKRSCRVPKDSSQGPGRRSFA